MAVSAQELEAWRRSHAALERAAGMLRSYQLAGRSSVAIGDVLDLLGQDPETPQQQERKAPARDPLDDPMTGARWAGPPGSTPPER